MTFAQFRAGVAKRAVPLGPLNPGLTAEDASALADHADVLPFARDLRDFADTAALVASLDLVITTDTAVAHPSGALGRPLWLLLSARPAWRWVLDPEDCSWDPSAPPPRQTPPRRLGPGIPPVGAGAREIHRNARRSLLGRMSSFPEAVKEIMALHAAGRFADMETCARALRKRAGAVPIVDELLGMSLCAQRRFGEALAPLRQAAR